MHKQDNWQTLQNQIYRKRYRKYQVWPIRIQRYQKGYQ